MIRHLIQSSALWLAILLPSACLAQPADLVLRNGKIVTEESAQPEAQALAASGGKIVAIGSNREMQRYIGPATRVIDLNNRLAIPGFIDGHAHFMGVGESKMILNLRDVKNFDEIVAMVAAAAREAKPGEWILGRGWHQAKWDRTPEPNVRGFPLNTELSKVSPNNPVLLEHASGHASFVNNEALRIAGIDRNTPDPPGGQVLKDAQGNPTGLLNERAQALAAGAHSAYEAKLPAA
jgi:predicted amidohydrolase YtcJ